MSSLSELGKQGFALSGGNYEFRTEYIFGRLNEVKPEMIEEATRQAREVTEKFASESSCRLGKLESASHHDFRSRHEQHAHQEGPRGVDD